MSLTIVLVAELVVSKVLEESLRSPVGNEDGALLRLPSALREQVGAADGAILRVQVGAADGAWLRVQVGAADGTLSKD